MYIVFWMVAGVLVLNRHPRICRGAHTRTQRKARTSKCSCDGTTPSILLEPPCYFLEWPIALLASHFIVLQIAVNITIHCHPCWMQRKGRHSCAWALAVSASGSAPACWFSTSVLSWVPSSFRLKSCRKWETEAKCLNIKNHFIYIQDM